MSESVRYYIVLEPKERSGYIARVPSLPEVAAEGDSESAAMRNAEEAIRIALAYRRKRGLPIPAVSSFEERMRYAENIMTRYRKTLEILAGE